MSSADAVPGRCLSRQRWPRDNKRSSIPARCRQGKTNHGMAAFESLCDGQAMKHLCFIFMTLYFGTAAVAVMSRGDWLLVLPPVGLWALWVCILKDLD